MRITLTVIFSLTFTQIALGQGTSSVPNSADLTVQVTAAGLCNFAKIQVPCNELGAHLVSMHMVPRGHLYLDTERGTGFEVLKAMHASLRAAGIKNVGFVGHVLKSPPQ
jgi:biopolymer transport protein ExbD